MRPLPFRVPLADNAIRIPYEPLDHTPRPILWTPSPNYGPRPADTKIDTIVLHGTAGSDESDLDWLTRPESKVSYHYLILRDGTIHQLVKDEDRAWHAGKSKFYDRTNVNDFSIGVAFSNKGPPELYTDAQYESGAWLCAKLWREHDIALERMPEHRAVSPGRKWDPWETFDPQRFFLLVGRQRYE